jgi:hypothetical protein
MQQCRAASCSAGDCPAARGSSWGRPCRCPPAPGSTAHRPSTGCCRRERWIGRCSSGGWRGRGVGERSARSRSSPTRQPGEVVRSGDVRSVELREGSALVPDGAGVAEVRGYEAGGRLLGSAVPVGGLVHPRPDRAVRRLDRPVRTPVRNLDRPRNLSGVGGGIHGHGPRGRRGFSGSSWPRARRRSCARRTC